MNSGLEYVYKVINEYDLDILEEMKEYWDDDNIEVWGYFFYNEESSYDVDERRFCNDARQYPGIDYEFRENMLKLINNQILLIQKNLISHNSDTDEDNDSSDY